MRFIRGGYLALAAILAFSLACAGKPTYQSVVEEMVETYKRINDVLDDVHDQDSAEDAKPKLQKLVKRLKEQKERLTEVKEQDSEAMDAVEKHSEELQKQTERFAQNMARLAMDPAAIMALGEVLQGAD